MKQGSIIPNGVLLKQHEYETVVFLTNLGHDIELIPPSRIPNAHTPDFKMDGLLWEMKCPRGRGKYLIRDTITTALKQSEYIIIDLRRVRLHQTKCLHDIEKFFHTYKRIKRIIVITKNTKLLDLKK